MEDFMDIDFGDVRKEKDEASVASKLSKSDAEIEALVVPDDTPELDRQALLLANGQKVQRECVITNLARTLRTYRSEAADRLFPVLTAQLASMDSTHQAKAADSLSTAAREGALADSDVSSHLVPFVVAQLAKGGAGAEPWVGTMLALLGHRLVPKRQLREQVLELALQKADPSASPDGRMMSAVLFGAIAAVVDNPSLVTSTFLDPAIALCQDTEADVRAAMCAQLDPIARGVGPAMAKQRLLPELLELLRDEQPLVRAAAFEAAVDTYEYWERDVARRRHSLLPAVRGVAEASAGLGSDGAALAAEDADMVRRVATALGPFVVKLFEDTANAADGGAGGVGGAGSPPAVGSPGGGGAPISLSAALAGAERSNDLAFVSATYSMLVSHADAGVRQQAARNLPALVAGVGPAHLVSSPLAEQVEALMRDSDAGVRRRVAAGLHQVARILGRATSARLLAPGFVSLLRAEEVEVTDALLPHLGDMLSLLLSEGDEGAEAAGGQAKAGVAAGVVTASASSPGAAKGGAGGGGGSPGSRFGAGGGLGGTASPTHATSPASPSHLKGAEASAAQRTSLTALLLPELVSFETRCRPSWRRSLALLDHYTHLPAWFDPDVCHTHFVPPLLETMHKGVPCCREAAARVLVSLMRAARVSSQRSALSQRLLTEFGHGKAYSQRVLFVTVCEQVMHQFSSSAFKAMGYVETLLSLCSDAVSNVRLAVLRTLPHVKRRLRLPADVKLIESLQEQLETLSSSDPMRDVQEAAGATLSVCAKVQPLVGSAQLSGDDQAKFAHEEALSLAEAEAALSEAKRRATESIAEQAASKGAKDPSKPPKRPGATGHAIGVQRGSGGVPTGVGRGATKLAAGAGAKAKPRASGDLNAISAAANARPGASSVPRRSSQELAAPSGNGSGAGSGGGSNSAGNTPKTLRKGAVEAAKAHRPSAMSSHRSSR